MKKVFSVVAVMLFMSTSSLNANIEVSKKKVILELDCYEFAFDQMEKAEKANLTIEQISVIGEHAYCICTPNCEW